MGQIVSMVHGVVPADRRGDVVERYQATLAAGGKAPGIVRTYLVAGEGGELRVVTVWRDQEALDAMRASGEEPFARRLLREAGATPSAEFFEVLAESD